MSRRSGPSLYFASDKVIFDAMNHSQVPAELIRQLLFERGIIVSQKTEKIELARHFSRLTADYFDHKSIGDRLGKTARKERVTYTEVKEPLSVEDIKNGAAATIEKLQAEGNIVLLTVDHNTVQILIQYEHIDYTESEFRQVQPRDGTIEFVRQESGDYVVRNTHNQFIDVATQLVFAGIEKCLGKSLPRTQISLEGHGDPVTRTRFFEGLVDDIEGHAMDGVTDAYIFRPKAGAAITSDGDTPLDVEKQPNVFRVTLKGNDVNKTFMARDLYRAGYYLVKVVWRMKAHNKDAELIEFEAQFGKPDSCTEFSYQAKSAILCDDDGLATDRKRTIHKDEQDKFLRLIEAAARRSLATLEA